MEIRYINQDDSLLAISNIYERNWKYAYQNIIPQDYLDSIPTGRWANSITKNGFTCSGEYLNDTIGGKELREVMYTYSAFPAERRF